MKNMAKNWKTIVIYLLIPIVLVSFAFYFASIQNKTELTYSQVVNLFKTDQVTEYNLDLTSGSLTYKTKDKPDETQKYSVPSVTYFVDDIRDSVNEYNDENPDNQISYNYTASSSKVGF